MKMCKAAHNKLVFLPIFSTRSLDFEVSNGFFAMNTFELEENMYILSKYTHGNLYDGYAVPQNDHYYGMWVTLSKPYLCLSGIFSSVLLLLIEII